jgi:hypothetical protein
MKKMREDGAWDIPEDELEAGGEGGGWRGGRRLEAFSFTR